MDLSKYLLEFRKSLLDAVDKSYQEASNKLLTDVLTDMVGRIDAIDRNMENTAYICSMLIEQNKQILNRLDTLHYRPDNGKEQADKFVRELVSSGASVACQQTPDPKLIEQLHADFLKGYHQGISETIQEVFSPPTAALNEVITKEPEEEVVEEETLQELEVDGVTYYYDSEGNVFRLDDDGTPEETPVGRYDTTNGEFELFSTLESFTYKGKEYQKDAENNVYLADGTETDFRFVNGKMVRKTKVK